MPATTAAQIPARRPAKRAPIAYARMIVAMPVIAIGSRPVHSRTPSAENPFAISAIGRMGRST